MTDILTSNQLNWLVASCKPAQYCSCCHISLLIVLVVISLQEVWAEKAEGDSSVILVWRRLWNVIWHHKISVRTSASGVSVSHLHRRASLPASLLMNRFHVESTLGFSVYIYSTIPCVLFFQLLRKSLSALSVLHTRAQQISSVPIFLKILSSYINSFLINSNFIYMYILLFNRYW